MRKNSFRSYIKGIILANQSFLRCYNLLLTVLRSPKKALKSMNYDKGSSFAVYTDGERETFFGYYDKSPENFTGEYVLLHSSDRSTWRLPSPSESIELIVFQKKERKVVFRRKIKAYNWQQGCRPQWIDTYSFIFNDYDLEIDSYISVLVDLDTGESRTFNCPVYDASKYFSLSINFGRLATLRPDYGYRNKSLGVMDDTSDGIFYISHQTGNVDLLLSISNVLEQFPLSLHIVPRVIGNKINHVMLSPDAKRFVFLYRYFLDTMTQKYDRLLMYDLEDESLYMLADTGMVSHYSWVDNKVLVVYMRGRNGQDGYYTIHLENPFDPIIEELSLPQHLMLGDGHPSFVGDHFLTDTYPQEDGAQRLIIYNIKEDQSHHWTLVHPFFFEGQSRCDLHPRWSADGKRIFFDSVMSGRRRMYSIELECIF